MIRSAKLSPLFWAGLILASLASLYSMSLRYRIESKNKAFAIAVEQSVISDAAGTGHNYSAALKRLQDAGLGMVVQSEETVADLIEDGRLQTDGQNYWTQSHSDLVRYALRIVAVIQKVPESGTEGQVTEYINGGGRSAAALRQIQVGINPEFAQAARTLRIPILVRASNSERISSPRIHLFALDWKRMGAVGYLSQGDDVVGFRSHLKDLSESLSESGLFYASPEFAKIAGEAQMVKLDPGNVIPLHAIQASEIKQMTPAAVNERYAKAFAERNERILLVRPLQTASDDPIGDLAAQIASLKAALVKEGGQPGMPHPFEDANVPKPIFIAIALGAALALTGLAMSFFGLTWPTYLLAIAGLGLAGLSITQTGRNLAALEAALIFPIAAYALLHQWRNMNPLVLYVVMTLVSLVGGFCVAGLLNGIEFPVRASIFTGVKPAHFLPLIVIGAMLLHERIPLKQLSRLQVT